MNLGGMYHFDISYSCLHSKLSCHWYRVRSAMWCGITQPGLKLVCLHQGLPLHFSLVTTQGSGSFLWTVLLMKLIPKAGSSAAETFPSDTSDHLAHTLDAYRERLLFHRLHGYPW